MHLAVSVIIPTYNRKALLRRALDSVLRQTLPPAEILVIDDGSTDGTHSLIRSEYPCVHYLYQENRGPAAARNLGIKASSGEWIAFLDSDDEWLPDKLKAQCEFIRRNPDCRILQSDEIWIRRGKRVNPMKKHRKSGGWIFERCLGLCLISPSAVIMHRSLFETCGFFDESFPACEDYELWLRITALYPVGYIDRPYLVKYGGHEDQRSREFPAMDRFRIRALMKILGSGVLTESQTQAALSMLDEKIRIYTRGVIKRGKHDEAQTLMNALAKYQLENCLDASSAAPQGRGLSERRDKLSSYSPRVF